MILRSLVRSFFPYPGACTRAPLPHSHPNAMDPGLAQRLLEVKMRYPCLGPAEGARVPAAGRLPEELLPAKSTVGEFE